jgi:hypothetical protein
MIDDAGNAHVVSRVLDHARDLVPEQAWEQPQGGGAARFVPLIRAARMSMVVA